MVHGLKGDIYIFHSGRKCEATDHTIFRETNVGAPLGFFFTQSRPTQSTGWCCSHCSHTLERVGFPSPVKPLWKCSHRYSQRAIPWVTLNPAKMTVEMNLYTECPFLLIPSTMSHCSINTVHSAKTAVQGSIDESEALTKNPRLPETHRVRNT